MSVFSGQCALVKWPDSNYPLVIRGGWFQSPNEVKLRHPSHKEWTKNPHPTTLRSGKVTYMTMLTRGLFQDVLPIDFAGDFPAITIFFPREKETLNRHQPNIFSFSTWLPGPRKDDSHITAFLLFRLQVGFFFERKEKTADFFWAEKIRLGFVKGFWKDVLFSSWSCVQFVFSRNGTKLVGGVNYYWAFIVVFGWGSKGL